MVEITAQEGKWRDRFFSLCRRKKARKGIKRRRGKTDLSAELEAESVMKRMERRQLGWAASRIPKIMSS